MPKSNFGLSLMYSTMAYLNHEVNLVDALNLDE